MSERTMMIAVLLLLAAIGATIAFEANQTLRGLTLLRAPFVERDAIDGKLKGFYVDLLDEMSKIGKFNYTLSEISGTSAGGRVVDNPTGLTNEVFRRRLDFAIADYLFKTPISGRIMEFSEPYFVSGFTALVDRKRLAAQPNIGSVEDIVNSGNPAIAPATGTGTGGDNMREPFIMTIVRSSTTYRFFSMTNDRVGQMLYHYMFQNSNQMVESREEGITRVLKSPYAFVQEGINNDLATDEHCELTQLPLGKAAPEPSTQDVNSPSWQPSQEGIKLEYAIAMSPEKARLHMAVINDALRELRDNGKLEQIRRRYWNRKCNGAAHTTLHYMLASFCSLFSLAISLFLLSE